MNVSSFLFQFGCSYKLEKFTQQNFSFRKAIITSPDQTKTYELMETQNLHTQTIDRFFVTKDVNHNYLREPFPGNNDEFNQLFKQIEYEVEKIKLGIFTSRQPTEQTDTYI